MCTRTSHVPPLKIKSQNDDNIHVQSNILHKSKFSCLSILQENYSYSAISMVGGDDMHLRCGNKSMEPTIDLLCCQELHAPTHHSFLQYMFSGWKQNEQFWVMVLREKNCSRAHFNAYVNMGGHVWISKIESGCD